jgi:hypothetical protein
MKKFRKFAKLPVLVVSAIFAFTACEKEKPVTPDEKEVEGWKIELIDSIPGANAGIYNMLAYDADSGVHIAYVVSENSTYSLKYAYKPYNGNWTKTEVANPISDNIIDIAVDNQKNVFIAYRGYDPTDNDSEKMYIAEKSINGSFNNCNG